MAKQGTAKTVNTKYMTLIVHGKRRMLLMMMAVFGTGILGFLFNVDAFVGPQKNWAILGLGIGAVLMLLIPQSEEWHYAPWQDSGQRCEKDIVD